MLLNGNPEYYISDNTVVISDESNEYHSTDEKTSEVYSSIIRSVNDLSQSSLNGSIPRVVQHRRSLSETEGGWKRNTKFLQTRWRSNIQRRQPRVQAQQSENKKKRARPTKWDIFCIMTRWHSIPMSVERFIETWHQGHYGPFGWIHKVKKRTLKGWRYEYNPNSFRWYQLCNYIEEYGEKKAQKKKSFLSDPFEDRYGLLPIFERYLLYLRLLKATSHEYRTIKFMCSLAQEVLSNRVIMDILLPRMSQLEQEAITEMQQNGISRNYIRKIMV